MKKIISVLLLIVFIGTNFSFAVHMCGYLECSDNQTCGKKAGENACIDKPPSEFEQAAKTLCPSATVTSANSAYINKGTDDICCHEE